MIVAAAFFLLTILLLWFVIAGRGGWKIKLPFVVLVPLFAFAIWHALETYRGWPARTNVPAKSIIVSYIIDEPDETRQDRGHIDLWLIPTTKQEDLLGYRSGDGEPRAYRMPYSRELHKALQGLAGKHGTAVLERGGKGHGHGRPGQKIPKKAYRAYILPTPLPQKGGGS